MRTVFSLTSTLASITSEEHEPAAELVFGGDGGFVTLISSWIKIRKSYAFIATYICMKMKFKKMGNMVVNKKTSESKRGYF